MANFTQYTTVSDIKQFYVNVFPDDIDDTQLQEAIDEAQNIIDSECGWSFQDETRTNEEKWYPEVLIDNEGRLCIRTDKCPITAVTSVAYRFQPQDAWTPVDASLIEFYPLPATVQYPQANANLVRCYVDLSAARITVKPRVQITYQGGFDSANPPPTLQRVARRMAYWIYRERDVVSEQKTITGAAGLGQVTIPNSMPPTLERQLKLWKRWA